MAQQHTVRGNATSVASKEGVTRVTYHKTVVVAWDDKTITLNSGGWRTNTTKTRMNQAANQFDLGFCVYQNDFEWFVVHNGETQEFADGIVLQRN